MKIAYLCDRERCGSKCSYPMCKHTWDIEHAVNFKVLYMETDKKGEIVYAEEREEENEDRL